MPLSLYNGPRLIAYLYHQAVQSLGSTAELKDAQDLKESLTFDGKVYWKLLPDGGKDGPYCQKCYDVDGLLVHLISEAVTYKGRQQNRLECKACNSGRIFAAK